MRIHSRLFQRTHCTRAGVPTSATNVVRQDVRRDFGVSDSTELAERLSRTLSRVAHQPFAAYKAKRAEARYRGDWSTRFSAFRKLAVEFIPQRSSPAMPSSSPCIFTYTEALQVSVKRFRLLSKDFSLLQFRLLPFGANPLEMTTFTTGQKICSANLKGMTSP